MQAGILWHLHRNWSERGWESARTLRIGCGRRK